MSNIAHTQGTQMTGSGLTDAQLTRSGRTKGWLRFVFTASSLVLLCWGLNQFGLYHMVVVLAFEVPLLGALRKVRLSNSDTKRAQAIIIDAMLSAVGHLIPIGIGAA